VGHTDDVGAEALNWELSQRRADAVANYLEAQGISGQRLRTEGRGATEPRAANDSNLSRRLNRRVEIYIAPRAREPQRAPVQRNLVVPLLSRLGAST
jgi:outer membrane protein OmpA-like peptidoglycan-associated protein